MKDYEYIYIIVIKKWKTVWKFHPYLPNGIIREIVAYTGATYKKRNGKYMGQIPKTDPRFALLLKIPTKNFAVNNHPVSNPNCRYFTSWVILTRIGERYYKNPSVRLMVVGVTYINDLIYGNKETIEYECSICDRSGNVRRKTYEYYRKDEKLDNMITKCDEISTRIDEMEKRIVICKKTTIMYIMLLRNACIMTSMFTVGLIVQYFRE